MSFVTYTDKPIAARARTPFVSLSPAGFLNINQYAYAVLGRPDAVTLAHDADLGLVRIAAAEPSDPGAYLTRGKAVGRSVRAVDFLAHIGVPHPAETVRLRPYETTPGALFLDLGGLR